MTTSQVANGLAFAQSPLERPKLEVLKLTNAGETLLLLPLARSWHAESQYQHLPFAERKLLAQVMRALTRGKNGGTFYAVWREEAVGVIDLAIGEAWMCEGGRYATCLAWFVRPDIRSTLLGGRVASSLLHRARGWSSGNGASGIFINGTHGSRNSLPRIGSSIGTNVYLSL